MVGWATMGSMNKTIADNRALLNKQSVFANLKEYDKVGGGSKTVYQYKSSSPEQVQGIRNKIMKQNQITLIKKTMVLIVSIIVAAIAVYFMTGQ